MSSIFVKWLNHSLQSLAILLVLAGIVTIWKSNRETVGKVSWFLSFTGTALLLVIAAFIGPWANALLDRAAPYKEAITYVQGSVELQIETDWESIKDLDCTGSYCLFEANDEIVLRVYSEQCRRRQWTNTVFYEVTFAGLGGPAFGEEVYDLRDTRCVEFVIYGLPPGLRVLKGNATFLINSRIPITIPIPAQDATTRQLPHPSMFVVPGLVRSCDLIETFSKFVR